MPRYPSQSPLPPLEEALSECRVLKEDRPKAEQVAEHLRRVIDAHRTTHNITFYSTRDIARFFKVSQNTAALASEQLENDGLLRRIRGSHTVLLGTKIIKRSEIRAVVGLMSWVFAQRFSNIHNEIARLLGEELWPHQIALEIIPHFDIGDNRPDLNESLRKHNVDFIIWPFPFSHHKDHLLHLEDRGIRNLVIGVDGVRSPFRPQILVDFRCSYLATLRYWREVHGINRVIVISPREFTPRLRIKLFMKVAIEEGFDCTLEKSQYHLPSTILARERERVGIALLDEHSTAEFTLYDPLACIELIRRHRILFGNNQINLPFLPDDEDLRVERIFIPVVSKKPQHKAPLAPALIKILTQWCAGDFTAPPSIIPTRFWENGRLWRYL